MPLIAINLAALWRTFDVPGLLATSRGKFRLPTPCRPFVPLARVTSARLPFAFSEGHAPWPRIASTETRSSNFAHANRENSKPRISLFSRSSQLFYFANSSLWNLEKNSYAPTIKFGRSRHPRNSRCTFREISPRIVREFRRKVTRKFDGKDDSNSRGAGNVGVGKERFRRSAAMTIIVGWREIKHGQGLAAVARTFFFEPLRRTDSSPDNNNSNNNRESWRAAI